MPLRWTVDHGAKLIIATASGGLARQDFESYMAAVAAEGAVGYRVLFDARSATADLRPGYLTALSQAVKDRRRDDVSDGRIALVVGSDAEQEMGGYFIDRTEGQRACRLFRDVEDARVWLGAPPLPQNVPAIGGG
ncbi:hypothetical protein FHP25_09690 [Vineibacter terrae]|uniref:STAS/SEC14 domain-containing protein n=1 Tax=Vineibacter terrae TaxID=2586908 RepID=A0A5C8PQM9_9HYPH|nr:hypothetical protein [Vineibacter terrae]TXL77684.1 hypothetical protein FHP25_09690 [Vineibacter terrae]